MQKCHLWFLFGSCLLIVGCQQKKSAAANIEKVNDPVVSEEQRLEAVTLSRRLRDVYDSYQNDDEVDMVLLSKCAAHWDPWVRSNCAGTIGALGIKCKKSDLQGLLGILELLLKDDDEEVRKSAKVRIERIKEVRGKYRKREGLDP